MDWVLRSPQVHSTFGDLGFLHEDGYQINENCEASLRKILFNILTEDKYLRSYRRNISFGQNIKKDLIPLLVHAKEDRLIELLIRIFVNLTIPVECLLSLDDISKSDYGRHTIFELNNLLQSIKNAFTDPRVTKAVIDFFRKNIDNDKQGNFSSDHSINISNCLLLLRNILHIPDETSSTKPEHTGPRSTVQNQIFWNIFSQSIDKVLIKLMTVPEAGKWDVTMIQLIALIYKDQHVATLHKLINIWLEASESESSEDNESNTPPERGSNDSSPLLTTSDSSDTGGINKSALKKDDNISRLIQICTSANKERFGTAVTFANAITRVETVKDNTNAKLVTGNRLELRKMKKIMPPSAEKNKCDVNGGGPNGKKPTISENSDCGYATQKENQGSISTSSNEDEILAPKPVHQKPRNHKPVAINKPRSGIASHERKRRKIVKRGKSNITNVQGLSHKTPTVDDISKILKDFTVDFLLKGYNSLVHSLHGQILTNPELEIDTSHFFWLVTYFLKFAAQIELDLEQMCSVLSLDIISYLTAQGVHLCEQFELAVKQGGNDLKPSIRRLHLVVTAIREFIQTLETYQKLPHVSEGDKEIITKLQFKMCEMDELRSLFVLLIRHYNPKYHCQQYLQDLVVTNHILLLFLDNVMRRPDYMGTSFMVDHIKQFAAPEVMYQYSLLLDNYLGNGEFVNDCIFTVMHHVGGEHGRLNSLFQPNILKIFTNILQSDYELCDDWCDLIEYVINIFVKKPQNSKLSVNARLVYERDIAQRKVKTKSIDANKKNNVLEDTMKDETTDQWTREELSLLNWNYMQCRDSTDVITKIIKLHKDNGFTKSRIAVIKELYNQKIVAKSVYDEYMKGEGEETPKVDQHVVKEIRDDDIGKLCDQLIQDGKEPFLNWLQKVLLDICYVKIYFEKKKFNSDVKTKDEKILNFEFFKKRLTDVPLISSVSYHNLLVHETIPLVPWNSEQAAICKDMKFLQLLHKLGFLMPVDSGKMFIQIPCCWSAATVYEMAGKIATIDKSKLLFCSSDIAGGSPSTVAHEPALMQISPGHVYSTDNCFRIHRAKHASNLINFTPMPGTSIFTEGKGEYVLNDVNKSNWLDVIRRSQDSNVARIINETKQANESPILKTTSSEDMLTTDTVPTIEVLDTMPGPSIRPINVPIPPVFDHDNTDDDFSLDSDDDSYNDTASVTSDLTRMYVSDEDDTSDVIMMRPRSSYNISLVHSDLDDGNEKKRQRVSPLDNE